ncbi:putative mediator of RNA polymerase II transcription subunit 29 isoform X2 [Eupeodes corollae]|uniref:putative mediator of RNA polymerase II transcription subunit 29 isoform X2 n=1 Tax=Eupeodes corollae TaxID=290404 RepID=UPI00249339AB|nr:putative mediator of RNA polymerase II transcription subunit 29 isoform X2 [Eupeodes corollae]
MVNAPAIQTSNKCPLSNDNAADALQSAEVVVASDSDREVNAAAYSSGVGDNLLETQNTSNDSTNSYADDNTNAEANVNATSTNSDTHNHHNDNDVDDDMTTTSTVIIAAEQLSDIIEYSTSDDVELNGNNIDTSANISIPKNEQSTQIDDDDNSSNCSSTRDNGEDVKKLQNNGEELIEENNVELFENLTSDNDNDDDGESVLRVDIDNTHEDNLDNFEKTANVIDDIEEETYCVGYFYGQDDVETTPTVSEIENVIESHDINVDNNKNCDSKKSMKSGLETVPEVNETSETVEQSKLIANSNLPPTTLAIPSAASVSLSVSATKPYNNPANRSIPQIIGIPGIMAQHQHQQQQQQQQHSMPQSVHKQHQPQQSVGGLLQPLHLATLGAHAGGGAAVNQQISPTPGAAAALTVSTAIQPHHHHHHHCVHHPHVHLHSPAAGPGQQATNGGVVGTATAAQVGATAAGHPHTHIFPLQVISLAQGPGTAAAAAAAGAAAAWPLVEAPIYVDANGEYRTYCPAHPQGPPPREHRVLVQLDAGVSLPLQIAGKRKVFRGKW